MVFVFFVAFAISAGSNFCTAVDLQNGTKSTTTVGPVFEHRMLVPEVALKGVIPVASDQVSMNTPNATVIAAAKTRPFMLSVGLPVLFRNSSVLAIPGLAIFDDALVNETTVLDTSMENTTVQVAKLHNQLRRSVTPSAGNMMQLHWDPIAARSAQRWANRCTASSSDPTERWGSGFSCGENIAIALAAVTWEYVVKTWADERENFTYGTGVVQHDTEHFVQLAWAASHRVGCGYKNCESFHVYVCHYCPR